MATLFRLGHKVFIARAVIRRVSTNSHLRLPAPCLRVFKPTAQRVIAAGALKPGRHSTGSLAAMISSFLFTIPSPVAAATGFIPNAPMRTREQNRRYRS